jgi:hypothetical protein
VCRVSFVCAVVADSEFVMDEDARTLCQVLDNDYDINFLDRPSRCYRPCYWIF